MVERSRDGGGVKGTKPCRMGLFALLYVARDIPEINQTGHIK